MINHTAIEGRLLTDPVFRTEGEREIAEVSIAHEERWRERITGAEKERVSYFGIIAHGNPAASLREVKKGQMIIVIGKLMQEETPEGPRGGKPKSKTKVRALRILTPA